MQFFPECGKSVVPTANFCRISGALHDTYGNGTLITLLYRRLLLVHTSQIPLGGMFVAMYCHVSVAPLMLTHKDH